MNIIKDDYITTIWHKHLEMNKKEQQILKSFSINIEDFYINTVLKESDQGDTSDDLTRLTYLDLKRLRNDGEVMNYKIVYFYILHTLKTLDQSIKDIIVIISPNFYLNMYNTNVSDQKVKYSENEWNLLKNKGLEIIQQIDFKRKKYIIIPIELRLSHWVLICINLTTKNELGQYNEIVALEK